MIKPTALILAAGVASSASAQNPPRLTTSGPFEASGSLREGDRHSMEVFLWAGETYMLEGECDADCRDVDLLIEGPGGVDDSDILPDAFPVLLVTAPVSAIYTVTIEMFDCWVEPCYWTVTAQRQE